MLYALGDLKVFNGLDGEIDNFLKEFDSARENRRMCWGIKLLSGLGRAIDEFLQDFDSSWE